VAVVKQKTQNLAVTIESIKGEIKEKNQRSEDNTPCRHYERENGKKV